MRLYLSLALVASSATAWTTVPSHDRALASSSHVGSTTRTVALSVSATEPPPSKGASWDKDVSSLLGNDGLYHLANQEQHAELMRTVGQDAIVVLKVYAPWCRACKALESKFLQITNDPKYEKIPLVWADLTIQHNKEFIKQLGVLALPTVQFYVQGRLTETFPCGPSKVPILKRKLAAAVNTHVDPRTLKLIPVQIPEKAIPIEPVVDDKSSKEPVGSTKKTPYGAAPAAKLKVDYQATMSNDAIKRMKQIPYFSDMSLADFDELVEKATLVNFEADSLILREGTQGNTFYMLESGSVEICQAATYLSDPLVAPPPSYLGTVINVLDERGDFFGERALMTGEPRAASIRASTEPIKVWCWDKTDFPASCTLSGRTRSKEANMAADDKYGVSVVDLQSKTADWQERSVRAANQVRGSTNSPYVIRGVDTDEEPELAEEEGDGMAAVKAGLGKEATILSLLSKFKMVRSIRNCLKYIVKFKAAWGDSGNRIRRSLLVSKLTPAQRAEFAEAFEFLDANSNGKIEMIELRRVIHGVMNTNPEQDTLLEEGLQKAIDSNPGDSSALDMADFMGLMAESEFYYLFNDIFSSLDNTNSGYVNAKDLNNVLAGVRDLISDDRNSIIDVEDQDMMSIDYEQFTRMLLGTSLK